MLRRFPSLVLGAAAVLASVTGGALVSGCALPPSHYSGNEQDRAMQPSEVRVYRRAVDDGTPLGRATSVCERRDVPDGGFDDRPLHQLDCSKPLLVGALRERAAAVGGTDLAELLCVDVPEVYGPETDLCTAKVVRREGKLPQVELREPESSHQAWDVALSFVPARGYRRGELRSPINVDRLDVVRQNEVMVGALTASCDGCDRDVVRDALRTVAAKLGARSIVGSHCTVDEDTWSCTAEVAAWEHDPAKVTAAR